MRSDATREVFTTRDELPCGELLAWASELGLVAGLSLKGEDFRLDPPDPGTAAGHWERLRRAFAPSFPTVVVGRQVHGTNLAVHQECEPGWQVLEGCDGHLSPQAGVLLCVTVADCAPIYLAHTGGRWIGLLHAGWRGVAMGLVEAALSRLVELAGCAPGDIVMHCGVGICGDCYEVGPQVFQAVTGHQASRSQHLDLRSEIAQRARRWGIEQVSISPWCTAHHHRWFYSHRASRGADGRMVAYLGRPLA